MESTRDPQPSASEDEATSAPTSSASDAEAASSTPPTSKADLGKRFIAILIDGIAASIVAMVPVVGWIVGGVYMVVRDGLEVDFMNRRSLGKKIMKLRPVRRDGHPMDLETSFRRNWMWAIGYLALIPIVGWILSPVIAIASIAIALFEVYKVFTDPEGVRWGDQLAGTKVIEVDE